MKCPSLSLILMAGLATGAASPALAQSPAELAGTARYVAAFQNPDGGYAPRVGQASTLGATSSAVRTLGYVAGSIRDVPACIAYVKSCFDPATGGFSQTPGGKPDVSTTAIGLMAVAALKLDAKPYTDGAIGYFAKESREFEQVRMSAAGLEAVKATSPDFPRWIEVINATKNAEGTYGQGGGIPRATGSAAAALLRMGVKLEEAQKAAIVAAIRSGQKPDGGWGEGGEASDLGSSYRIMRALFMMKEKPDLGRLRGYLASHRQADGGYGPRPGAPADPGSTYSCSIMAYWARQLDGEPAIVETAGFAPLFNGKDLDGWEGDSSLWSAKDGMLVGESRGIKANQFLATEASHADFILKFSVRLVGDSGNSGVQFRSVRVPGTEMSGYQADVGPGYWGSLYDESRRNKALTTPPPQALERLHKGDWNQITVQAMGPEITLTLNGAPTAKYVEADPAIARDGKIALQIHAGGPMRVEFKDIYIQDLPRPMPAGDDIKKPGFHLRTVATPSGPRKYMVHVPSDYDGTKAFPAILFLHGSGERGDDGIKGGQIGLGAAILAHPERFPAIAVLPQASKTWAADSDDARAALAALDDVMASYKVDKDRVALTGLSMGGSGTWSIASAHPETFSALVAICGTGKPEMAQALKAVPTWIVTGDLDRDVVVKNVREMAQALRDAGGSVHQTEFRAVPHNSWDRAYDDPILVDWMISKTRKAP